ncbi:MAG: transporter substrate-binding domain-containing protein [Burkholderiales bacterium]|nr:transporter substrate-binding domain-containing protein [Burkholderiales bacterium]
MVGDMVLASWRRGVAMVRRLLVLLPVKAAGSLIALLALLSALHCSAAADPRPQQQACSRVLKVAISPIGKSMMVSPTGQVSGIVSDFLGHVSELTGCKFEFVVVPRVRAFLMLKNGSVDIVPAVVRTAERDQSGAFIHAYDTTPMLVSLKNTLPPTLALDELQNGALVIGVVRGYDYGPTYTGLIEHPKVKPRVASVADPDTLARLLAAHRIDAVLMVPSAFVNAAEAVNIADAVDVTRIVGMPSAPTGMYINVLTIDAAERARLTDAIAVLARRGEYGRLLKRYYSTPTWALYGLDVDASVLDGAR